MEDDLAGSCVELLRDVEWQRTPQAEYGPHLPWGVDELKGYADTFATHVIQSLTGMGIIFHPIQWTESPQPEHEVVTREAAKRDRLRWLDDAFFRLSSLVDERKELPRGWEFELPKYALNTADAFSRWLGDTIADVARANDLSFGRSAVRHAHLWLLSNVTENKPAWPAEAATVSDCIRELERLRNETSPQRSVLGGARSNRKIQTEVIKVEAETDLPILLEQDDPNIMALPKPITPSAVSNGLADLYTPTEIADLVGLERTSLAPYEKTWPEPIIASRGRQPSKFSYVQLKPVLEKQFPYLKFSEDPPKRPIQRLLNSH
ncbi:hypothetical protein [Schlesneria sp. DSM 10557]|uniref:hypothetical protein n=1 Tax=Schlesneria sp. DSM 10557 TaxID=3044399 RepID=UPI00359FBEBD